MNQLQILKVIESWRKPGRLGVSINDVDKYLNYEDVKHWFYVNGFSDNWFYIAVYDSLIVGYYFRNNRVGGRVEVLPAFRKSGIYGHLNVYKELLNRITERFPNEFYSTVSCLNIPSLSSHFKNNFKIDVINHYENEKDDFIYNLITKVVMGKKNIDENPISKRKIKLNLFYEYGDKSYRYDDKTNFFNIKKMFIDYSREIKCYVLTRNGKIYLEKKDNEFEFPEGYKNKFNVYDVKYKLIYPKVSTKIIKDKSVVKKDDLNIEEINKKNTLIDWFNKLKPLNVNYRLSMEIQKKEIRINKARKKQKEMDKIKKAEKLKVEKLQKSEKIRIKKLNIKNKFLKIFRFKNSNETEIENLQRSIFEQSKKLNKNEINDIRENFIKKGKELKTDIVPRGTIPKKNVVNGFASHRHLKKNEAIISPDGFIETKPKIEEFKKKEISDDGKETLWGKIQNNLNN